MALISFSLVGFIIALVRPEQMAIDRYEALIPCLLGSPKEILDAPQVELTPISRSFLTKSKTCKPAVAIAPMGITKGSTTISLLGIP